MIVHYLYRWSSSFLFRCNIVLSYQKPKVRNFVCMYSYIEYNWCSTTFYELLTKKNHVYAFPHYCTIYYGVPLYDYEPLSSTFSLSPIGQRCESAKLQREKFEGARTKELKCEDMTAKSEEAKVRSCKGKEAILLYRLFASQLCTFVVAPSHFRLHIFFST